MNASLTVEQIETAAGFAALKPDWNRLADRAPPPRLFLRHEWFDAALAWHGDEGTALRLLVLRRDGIPIAIAPFMAQRQRRHGLQVRSLRFLAVPDTQACGLVAAPDDLPMAASALLAHLGRTRDWDLLDLHHLPADGPSHAALAEAARRHGLHLGRGAGATNHLIDCRAGWATYYATRSRRLKKGNNLVANRLRKRFQRIEVVRHRDFPDPAALERCLEQTIRISAGSWKHETGLSLDHPAPGRFIQRLSRLAAAEGWLSIWLLYLDERAVAMEYQLVHDGRVHALRSDFLPLDEGLSPGAYLNQQVIRTLCEERCTCYAMGPGDNAYKLHWSNAGAPLERLQIHNRTAAGRWLAAVEGGLKPLARRVRDACRGKTGS